MPQMGHFGQSRDMFFYRYYVTKLKGHSQEQYLDNCGWFTIWGIFVRNGPCGLLYKIIQNALFVLIMPHHICIRNHHALGFLLWKSMTDISLSPFGRGAGRDNPSLWPPIGRIPGEYHCIHRIESDYAFKVNWNLQLSYQIHLSGVDCVNDVF